ncbi:double-strand break repair helicase AddA [Sphingorhabdus buctiana]|uniref:DNA 3'-5' helicase n=1 Tax=Sphingorhabdus buctiana TaxID=1508805 RepID=A0ABW4MBS5_9SPHN
MALDSDHIVHDLTDAQQGAVEPAANVWLSASAGSGKTQVLSARVIRLLLAGAKPEEILCLTFTKAAAAEMAERINRKLASWVQMKEPLLAAELRAIGADYSRDNLPAARKLFAEILDAPGGGLQIMTIHAFCQSLLGSFPEEAGIMPGFEPLDDRTKAELQREVLAQISREADETGDRAVAESLHRLGLERGEDGAWAFLQRCAATVETMRQLPEGQGLLQFVRNNLGVSYEEPTSEILAFLVANEQVDVTSIKAIIDLNIEWATKTGSARAETINNWLSSDISDRVNHIEVLHKCWTLQKTGKPHELGSNQIPRVETYVRIVTELHFWTEGIVQAKILLNYADRLASALFAGKAFALRYEALKRSRGLVDFDDLIAKAADLLTTSGMNAWVRYKLDRRIDHVLVDEAQDTNAKQWNIIKALTEDFFAGEGAKEGKSRTIFAVGDFKQAIYGFQGTDPARYREAGEYYAARLEEQEGNLQFLTLSQSFRSTQPILQLVNAVVAQLGHERFGLAESIDDHVSQKLDIGSIELLEPVTAESAVENGDSEGDEEKWLGPEKRELAAVLAQKIKDLIDEQPVLASTNKPLTPGDIMVLFRKRTEVTSLLVARLHALGVPVAGIDRMQIGEQLAVQDLASAIRFVLQPQDDLSLACLLVSPLIGWSQEDLLRHGYRSERVSLWHHIRNNKDIAADLQPLHDMLAVADFTTPYRFLEEILSGATAGRKKFAIRLGAEVLVPIEEFLNLAIEFEQSRGGTLQQFLDWFERNSSEIKRERLTGSNEVQIMTVHGAKGLQAPVVILADMTVDPGQSGKDPNSSLPLEDGGALPLLRIDKESRVGCLDDLESAREAKELNEHYRLLYVALTRAEERLIMAGSLGAKKAAKPECWYAAVEQAMDALGCTTVNDPKGRLVRIVEGQAGTSVAGDRKPQTASTGAALPVPEWLSQPARPEARPPRPLAPSQLDDSDVGDRPAEQVMRHAAERGKLVHGLIERIDADRMVHFAEDAARWLKARDREGRHDHLAIISQVQSLVQDVRWQDLFSSKAKAEIPIAAVVGETVITGRIDRLLVDEHYVRIVDFKTSRRVPKDVAGVNLSELRQMAHYVAAVERIFPGRKVSAALLYTHAPLMMELPLEALAPHKPV